MTVTTAIGGVLYSLSIPSQGWSSSTLGLTSVYVYTPTLKGSKHRISEINVILQTKLIIA